MSAACRPGAAPEEVLTPPAAPTAPENVQPNVVVVVFDTTRGDRCSVNGYPRPTTLQMESLAKDGTTFRTCWSPSPWTAPAHASLFTGLRPPHHGLMSDGRSHLMESFDTLAETLRDEGYATACITQNSYVGVEFGLTQGFDHVDAVYARPSIGYPRSPYTFDAAARASLAAHRAGRPFFTFVNVLEPHAPYEPPREIAREFLPSAAPAGLDKAHGFGHPTSLIASLGLTSIEPQTQALISDLYDAEIATADRDMARLVDPLRAEGILDNTIFIVTGDHGENLGDHGLYEHALSVHRTLLHIPLVVRAPESLHRGRLPRGSVVDDLVRLEDIFPTLLELLSLPVPTGLDGESLLGNIPGRVGLAHYRVAAAVRERVARDYPDADLRRPFRGMESAFDGRYHLIRYSDGEEDFFDVATDPGERTNLRDRHGPARGRLRSVLDDR